MPRIAVYLRQEDPQTSQASHSSSTSLVALVVADGSGRFVTLKDAKTVLQLTTGETWRQLKDRLRPRTVKGRLIPGLKAPLEPTNLDLNYPEKNRESMRHPHEAFVRECRLAQARKDALAQAQ